VPPDTYTASTSSKDEVHRLLAVLRKVTLFHPESPDDRQPVEINGISDGVAVRLMGRFAVNANVETVPNLLGAITTDDALAASAHELAPAPPSPPSPRGRFESVRIRALVGILLAVVLSAVALAIWMAVANGKTKVPSTQSSETDVEL
jgi:hypothetical protein